MAKYSPSIKNNNDLRDKAVNEINAIIYLIENKRIKSKVDPNQLIATVKVLKDSVRDLENAYGTGKEDIGLIYERTHALVEKLQRSAQQDMIHRISDVVNDINNNVNEWKDVLDGKIVPTHSLVGTKKDKRRRAVRKLDDRLAELANIRAQFDDFANESETEIEKLKKDKDVYEDQLVEAEDELLINELSRKLDGVENGIATEAVRKENYSACSNLLGMVYSNSKALIREATFSKKQLYRAKAYLDIDRLRTVLTDPQRAISIVKQMSKDIENIGRGVLTIDKAMSSVTETATAQIHANTVAATSTIAANPKALARKEALMAKKRESEANKKMAEELSNLDNSASATDVKKTEQV